LPVPRHSHAVLQFTHASLLVPMQQQVTLLVAYTSLSYMLKPGLNIPRGWPGTWGAVTDFLSANSLSPSVGNLCLFRVFRVHIWRSIAARHESQSAASPRPSLQYMEQGLPA
jgi:hypothetical protein